MVLHPDSYLPEFFTEERLAHYRELQERFPLWCGHWPPDQGTVLERLTWDSAAQIRGVIDKAKIELEKHQFFLTHWFATPQPDLLPGIIFEIQRYEGEVELDDGRLDHATSHHAVPPEPNLHTAWLSALNYVGHPWMTEPADVSGPSPDDTAAHWVTACTATCSSGLTAVLL